MAALLKNEANCCGPQNPTSPDSRNWLRSVTLRHRFWRTPRALAREMASFRHAPDPYLTPRIGFVRLLFPIDSGAPARTPARIGFVLPLSHGSLARHRVLPPRIGSVLPELQSRHLFRPVPSNPLFGRSPPASSPVETTASVCYAQGVEFITLVLPGRCGQAYPRG